MTIGTPFSSNSTKLMLLGSGELAKEVAIEATRLGLEVVAVDRYKNAPAMHVAQRSHVIDMLDYGQLEKLIRIENPSYILPEIEAIATDALVKLESEGFNVCPSAKAVSYTMNRKGIRKLAAEELGVQTSKYRFASSLEECISSIEQIGTPCIVKPVMSSSGKGQVFVKERKNLEEVWAKSVAEGRGSEKEVIVESLIDFDYEITLLTVRHSGGVDFCRPIGHIQEDGDYRGSWQPQDMSQNSYNEACRIAGLVTQELGGWGIYGVELFIKGDQVWFSEVSPRPHDTGLVTLISQRYSQFELHVKAILGVNLKPYFQDSDHLIGASKPILGHGDGSRIGYEGVPQLLSMGNVGLRIFGKPDVAIKRRLAVVLASGGSVKSAVDLSNDAAKKLKLHVE